MPLGQSSVAALKIAAVYPNIGPITHNSRTIGGVQGAVAVNCRTNARVDLFLKKHFRFKRTFWLYTSHRRSLVFRRNEDLRASRHIILLPNEGGTGAIHFLPIFIP